MKTDRIENRLPKQGPSSEEIAARAYQIYELAGRPQGQDLDHWLTAEALLAAEHDKTARAARTGKRSSKPSQPPASTPSAASRSARAPILLPATLSTSD